PFLRPSAVNEPFRWPLITASANPHGRVLAGSAAGYRGVVTGRRITLQGERGGTKLVLDPAESPESVVAAATFEKYAGGSFASPVGQDRFVIPALGAPAAGGVFCGAPDQEARDSLEELDLVTVANPAVVTDLSGYRLSVDASRRATISGDPALRAT